MDKFARALATAKRLIDKNGQAVVYRRAFRATPVDQPWRDLAAGDPDDTPVRILWVKPTLRTMFFLENDRKDDVPKGVEQAIMAAQDFEPDLKDVVLINGVPQRLYRLEPIKPNGDVILWNLYIQRAGA